MHSRLLSHIAFKFSKHPENVANESLCFILNSDEMAYKKLCSAIRREDLPALITNFHSELSTDDNGRPDITGVGIDGKIPLIIEGKFWASLTENQPHNYLKELDDNGALLFVCPEMRASRLKDELEERTKSSFDYIDNAYFVASIKGRTVVIIDWLRVLSIIEEYASLNNTALSNDIQQLKSLCSQMDSKGFLPLSYGDLNEYHGRLCDQLSLVIDAVKERLKSRDYSDLSGLKTGAVRLEYGFYVRIHGFGSRIYFSANNWHSNDVKTPYWIGVGTPNWKPDRNIYDKFNVSPELKDRVRFDGRFAQVAIPLKTGLDQEQLTEHIVRAIDCVAEVLERLKGDYKITGLTEPPDSEAL